MTLHRLLLTLICLTSLLGSGCAGKQLGTPSKEASANTPLSQMSEEFLYLAAQDALRQGQPALAIQFLSMLVKKSPDQNLPRLQLAELLLHANKVDEAITHIDAVLGESTPDSATTPDQAEPFILRARATAMSGESETALDILTELLSRQPDLLNARLLHVTILVSLKRPDEAHQSIVAGLRSNESPQLWKLQADLFIRQNRLDEAVRSLEAMRKLDADDETPVLLLHQIALRQNKSARAEQILRDYIEQQPESILVRNTLGRLLVQSGRLQEAIGIYKGLVRDTGGTSEALSALGLLYYQTKEYENAAAQFRQALKNSSSEQSRFYLAASLEALGKTAEAKQLYMRINRKSIAYADAQLRLANMEFAAKEFRAAEKRTKAILKTDADNANGYTLLSSIYLVQGKYRKLLDETESALSLPQITSRLLFNRAIAYEYFKEFEGVEKSLQRLLASDPGHAEALNFLGYIYAEQGLKLTEAETLIKRALKQKPDDGYYLDSLAWVYFQRGDYKKAIELQTSAIEKIADDPVMYEHMGDILWKDNQHEAARNHWKRAIELDHQQPKLLNEKIIKGL